MGYVDKDKINNLYTNIPTDLNHTQLNSIVIAKGNSGATVNYWQEKGKNIIEKYSPKYLSKRNITQCLAYIVNTNLNITLIKRLNNEGKISKSFTKSS